MKQTYLYFLALFTIILFNHQTLRSQASQYTVTSGTVTFSSINGSNFLAIGGGGGAFTGSVPIGFTFEFEGVGYTQVKVSEDGYLTFNLSATATESTNDLDNTAAVNRPLLAPLWDDQEGKGGFYSLSGTAPNRVFTVEWYRWEWTVLATLPVLTYQIKLYEGSNEIDFIYTQESEPVNSGSASIGLSGTGTFLSLQNTTASPSPSNTMENDALNAKPANGQYYRFSPPVPPPPCNEPTNLAVNNITDSSAEVSWITGGASNWNLEFGPAGFTIGSGSRVNDVSNPYTIMNLDPSTMYEVYVQDSCNASTISNWSDSVRFETLAEETPTGISVIGRSGFVFYPNPATDQLTIDRTGEGLRQVEVMIRNNTGQLLLRRTYQASTFSIDLSEMTPGLYWLTLKNNSTEATEKFIVH